MKSFRFFMCCLLSLLIASCGGSKTSNSQNPNIFPPLNGSISILSVSAVAFTNLLYIAGTVQTDAAGNMSGTLGVASNAKISNCFPAGSSALFTGTRNLSTGSWTMTSAPMAGQVITMNVIADPNGSAPKTTYTVTGGCMTGDNGRFEIFHLLSGTFTGAFFAGGTPIATTLTFGAPGMPQNNGLFPLTLTATFSNATGCGGFTSATVMTANQSGESAGVTLQTSTGDVLDFSGSTVDSSATIFEGSFTISGTGPCSGAHGGFNFTKM